MRRMRGREEGGLEKGGMMSRDLESAFIIYPFSMEPWRSAVRAASVTSSASLIDSYHHHGMMEAGRGADQAAVPGYSPTTLRGRLLSDRTRCSIWIISSKIG